MRWLIQENLNSSRNYLDVVDALEATDTYYLIVAFRGNTLVVLDKYTKEYLENSNVIIENFTKDKHVMVYGSKLLAEVAESRGYIPGSFHTADFEYPVLLSYFGDFMLNCQIQQGDLFHLNPVGDTLFIRPSGNNKLFTGGIFSLEEFNSLKNIEQTKEDSPYRGVELISAPVKTIYSEFRFFIVDCKIVAYSSYKCDGSFSTDLYIPFPVMDFVTKMMGIFQPSIAYVIDVADTPNGYKIVEFNNINTSGVYGANIESIVKAINKLPASLFE